MLGGRTANGITTFSRDEYDDHQKTLSSKKEWPGVNIKTGSQVTFNGPMLVMELHRLVPFKDNRYISFHPFNMPYIKVRKIELVGIVTNVKHSVKDLFLTKDGTGVIQVNYKLQEYKSLLKQRNEINEKYRNEAENLKTFGAKADKSSLKKFPDIRPHFSYPRNVSPHDIAVLENKWSQETNGGLLGKTIQPLDYVYVIGYPTIDTQFQKVPEKVTADFIEHSRIIVFAMSLKCITEEMYNKKLLTWLNTIIRQRYTDNKDEKEI
ncbi:uncharacterized protein [Cardiocondyla obscurior]|uniref:uncharacterized protein isoform X2 n=1 Tax=Cardiocondyla obscurior TaxID=286306 RepID=UPI00396569FE